MKGYLAGLLLVFLLGLHWLKSCFIDFLSQLFGKPGNNPLCHHRALEMEKRGLRERLVPVARAPGEPFDHGLFEDTVHASTN